MNNATDTNRFAWLSPLLGVYLIATVLWRAFVPAHEFPGPGTRNLTIGLDLLCLVCLIGLRIQRSRRQPPAGSGLKILFWFALLAGLGLFAIRLNGNESWWTGHVKYELLPRSGDRPENSDTPKQTEKADSGNTTPTASTPAAPGSPSEAYKAYYAAHKNRDIATMKALITKDLFSGIYERFEPKKADELIDQALRQEADRPLGPSDDIRNEVVTGKTATAETLTPNGNWEPRQFVKEDGKWKLRN